MAFAPVSAANLTGVYMIGFETTQHEAFSEDVQDILENGNYADSGVMDMVSSIEMMNSTTLIMQVFLYGFITLIGADFRRQHFQHGFDKHRLAAQGICHA